MGNKGHFFTSSIISIAVHVVVIVLFIGIATARGCFRSKKPLEIAEFTIAVDPYEDPNEPEPVKEPEPEPKSEPKEIPEVAQKPKPKPKPKKPAPKKKPRPKIVKGPKVVRKTQSVVKTKVKPKSTTLSEEEIKKFLKGRSPVTVGEKTSLPSDERSRNASIIKKALYSAWRQPSHETAGKQIATIRISLGKGGTLSNPRVVTSSGSTTFDQSALEAVRAVARIPELSLDFLREFPELDIEFKLD